MGTPEWIETAARQHGALSRVQARAGGLPPRAIRQRIAAGEVVEVTPLVLRLTGAPVTPDQRLMVAVLDAGWGACICLDSAAAMFGIPGFRLEPIHVWRIRGRSNHDARVSIQHKTRALPPHHVLRVRGIPVTSPTRLFVDEAGRLTRARSGRLLDDVWGRNLTDFYRCDSCIAELSRPGRTGLVNARELVQERGPDYRPPASNLERRVMQILDRAGHHGFERQVNISDDHGWIGRVDFKHRHDPLVLEVQSELYHAGLTNEADDAERIARLEAAGLVVVQLLEFDVWHRPDVIVTRVETGFERVRARAAR
jgi:hypothetical protein